MFGVDRYFGGKDRPSLVEVGSQLLGRDVLGQVLDDDVELGDEFGVLDLPHQPELLAVQLLVVFVLQCLLRFFLVPKVDLAKP